MKSISSLPAVVGHCVHGDHVALLQEEGDGVALGVGLG